MLYVVVKAQAEQQVPKVVQVAEAAKRMHYKSGGHDQELHQYVKWEDLEHKGPKVIKLDDPEEKKEYKPPQTIIIHLSKIPMPELQPKAPPKLSQSSSQQASRPMNWFGFGAGPSDAKSSGASLAKSSSATNLRPDSGHTPTLRPKSGHASSSDSAQTRPSRSPKPATAPAPPKPKDKIRKEKDKEKKEKLKKPQEPPQQQPPSRWPILMPGSYGTRPSPSPPSPQMPGAMPPSSPATQNSYFPPHKPPPNPPARFPPPPVPPPGSQQPAQPAQGLAGSLTNQIANVGYSFLDRLTNNTPSTRPK